MGRNRKEYTSHFDLKVKMKKLHIAFISSSDPSIAGGVQEHIIHLSKHLRKKGHAVDIFGPTGQDRRMSHYHKISSLIDIPIPGGSYSSIAVLDQSFKHEKVFNSKKYDLIHIHEPYSPFAAWTILDKLKAPTVATFHTAWDDTSPLNIINAFIPIFKDQFSRIVQSAIYVSSITKKRWKDICSASVYQTIIANAVDTEAFKPKAYINKVPHILFAARLVSRKGVLRLLNAVKILRERGHIFRVTIMGDGKEKKDLITSIKKQKLGKFVTYLGEIKGKARLKYFCLADIFCAPYVNEAAPLAILEAISSGLPIVGFMNSSFKESLSHYPGKNLLVKCSDNALAGALEALLVNRQLIQSIKDWCIAQRDLLSWDKIACQTENAYYQTIKMYEKKTV